MDEVRDWLNAHAHRYFPKGCEEFDLMRTLLIQHPNYSDWKYQEPIAFKTTRSPKKKAIQVLVKFEGLEWRSVSWRACVNKKVKKITDLEKCSSAMRYAIREQISAFKMFNFRKICEICESNKDIEVDHDKNYYLFSELRDDFIKDNGVPKSYWWDKKATSFRASNSKEWLNEWQRFHANNARLRYLCSKCNILEK